MQEEEEARSQRRLSSGKKEPAASLRDRLAIVVGLATAVFLGSVFLLAGSRAFLMPGPLASAHGAIEDCKTCHTKSGDGQLSWLHGLVAGDPLADSKACLTCHKMPDTALNAHSASLDVLKESTDRLTKIASTFKTPQSVRVQAIAFPTDGMIARGMYCATCHQDHQGSNFSLSEITGEQCRSCHAMKFADFDGHHPEFETYPFDRRSRIIYDHAGHFSKHYPEVAKKDSARRIPDTCSSCHESRGDGSVMSVASFDKTCSACHFDQITGKERASGPKGIAFLSLPGIDLSSIKQKNGAIGEWPEDSEARLTPFMKMMRSRNEKGRVLVRAVDHLDLLDLSNASDEEIKAVIDLAWEIKSMFFNLISGKTSDVLGDLGIGVQQNAELVAHLTAGLPRDVLFTAQQRWLPNLAVEMANGQGQLVSPAGGWEPEIAGPVKAKETVGPVPETNDGAPDPGPRPEISTPAPPPDTSDKTETLARNPQACLASIFGQCVLYKSEESEEDAAKAQEAVPQKLQGAFRVGLGDVGNLPKQVGEPDTVKIAGAMSKGGTAAPSATAKRNGNGTDKTDDLLFPTKEELRELNAHRKRAGRAARADEGSRNTSAASPTAPGNAPTSATPTGSIASDVDPESWAQHGGWYQSDHAIFYRPAEHKDKFIYTWLKLTGPQAQAGAPSPSAAVFDALTGKDAQGSCTKCHSVEATKGRGRMVNFSPLTIAMKQGRFTGFNHEPHFGVVGNRGCLTCHSLEKDRPYLKGYEQDDPLKFAAEFGPVKRESCQACHSDGKARRDCLLCHKYHVGDVIAPITDTKLHAP